MGVVVETGRTAYAVVLLGWRIHRSIFWKKTKRKRKPEHDRASGLFLGPTKSLNLRKGSKHDKNKRSKTTRGGPERDVRFMHVDGNVFGNLQFSRTFREMAGMLSSLNNTMVLVL